MHYAVVAVDYFTKWVEAKALTSITPAKIEELSTKTSSAGTESPTPSYLTMEHRSIANEFKEFCDNLQVKKVFFSVTQPQANRQVKAVNKMIKYNLKTKLVNLKEGGQTIS